MMLINLKMILLCCNGCGAARSPPSFASPRLIGTTNISLTRQLVLLILLVLILLLLVLLRFLSLGALAGATRKY